ncbi:MAG: hypothetical protein IJ832_02240 [Bacteroidaceae bacterium]|nr:hypothetical protein [Bacteroidaceae bacterium]
MTFLSLFDTSLTSVLNGIVVTCAILAALYFVLKSLSRNIVRTPIFYITGIVIAVLLIVQISLMIGAIKAKDAADAAEIYLSQKFENQSGIIGANDSQQILESVIEAFPIIGVYVGIANFSGHDVSNIAESMHETMIEFLNTYIWHRIGWAIGIIAAGCLIVMMYDKRNPSTGKPKTKARMTSYKNYDDF